jgi:Leucine Rich Repeat (LRR) protein
MKAKVLIFFLALAGLLPLAAQAQVNYAVSGNTAYVTNSPNASGNIVIASTYNGYPVTSIGEGAFENSILKSVTIGTNIASIGDFAFYYCASLMNVIIGTNVMTIGHDTFYGCALTNVLIPGSVTSLGDGAFAGCNNLTNITFLGDAPAIVGGNSAFYGDRSTAIFYYYGASDWNFQFGGLPTVELGIPPFTYVVNNGSIIILGYTGTNGVVTISGTINGYPIRSIRPQAFYNSANLTNVVIDNGVTNIGDWAFYRCVNLASVTISNSITSLGVWVFYGCTSLTNVVIGNGVENIGDYTFCYCTNLTSVIIPNSVTNIGNFAFQGCTSLKNVIIASGVTNIGNVAFAGCAANLAVIFLGNPPAFGNNIFGIPSSSYDAPPFYVKVYYYYGASGWGATYGGLKTSELASTPQIVGGANVQSNNFSFTIIGTNGMSGVVEASTNLVSWQPIWTNTLSPATTNLDGSATFTDSQWTNYPARYYRAR